MAVPGEFHRPPYTRALSPLKAVFACFCLVIRQAVTLTRRSRAPACRSSFLPRERPVPYANTDDRSEQGAGHATVRFESVECLERQTALELLNEFGGIACGQA